MSVAGKKGLSQVIRQIARSRYIEPAVRSGKATFSVRVRDLMDSVREEKGIAPEGNAPQFCTAFEIPAFLEENRLEIDRVDGPPSKLSTTVVVHYRVRPSMPESGRTSTALLETPADRAHRHVE